MTISTSDQISDLASALAKAQSEMENVSKDAPNPHFRSKYATLAAVLEEVRPKLAKHGISVWQAPINGEGTNIGVVTRLIHSSGQWLENTIYVAPSRFDAQGVGSVITYLRRYSLMAAVGIAPEDDDGQAAVAKPMPQRPGARERERLWTAPEPPPAPVHPETGEVSPHEIMPPQYVNGSDQPDYIGWGSRYVAALKTASSLSESLEWEEKNADVLAVMSTKATKAYNLIKQRTAEFRAKYPSEEVPFS